MESLVVKKIRRFERRIFLKTRSIMIKKNKTNPSGFTNKIEVISMFIVTSVIFLSFLNFSHVY